MTTISVQQQITQIERQERRIRHDLQYMSLAHTWAKLRSKDPSTQCGAVVVNAWQTKEWLGYNGFPRGVHDTDERYNDRELKYPRVVHAEANALLKAGIDGARGGSLYIFPLFSCNECAQLAIQAGIARVISPKPAEERWSSSYEIAQEMYDEAGVKVTFYDPQEVIDFIQSALG